MPFSMTHTGTLYFLRNLKIEINANNDLLVWKLFVPEFPSQNFMFIDHIYLILAWNLAFSKKLTFVEL